MRDGRRPSHPVGFWLFLLWGCGSTEPARLAVTEEGFFSSGGVELSYALDIPREGTPPYTAVVFGHGSGAVAKADLWISAQRMLRHGIVTLRFDKRGVGRSGGVFDPTGVDLHLLASDLVAGVEFLGGDPRVNSSRIGLIGASQAGWVIPIASTSSDAVRFNILLSGPAVTVAQQNQWTQIAEDLALSIDELSVLFEAFELPPGDFDPRPVLESVTVPSLWIFGDQDRIVPARQSAAIIEAISLQLGRPFSIITYPNGDHGLRDVETGVGIPWWEDVLTWIEVHTRE